MCRCWEVSTIKSSNIIPHPVSSPGALKTVRTLLLFNRSLKICFYLHFWFLFRLDNFSWLSSNILTLSSVIYILLLRSSSEDYIFIIVFFHFKKFHWFLFMSSIILHNPSIILSLSKFQCFILYNSSLNFFQITPSSVLPWG